MARKTGDSSELTIAQRRIEVVEKRKAGKSFRTIGSELSISEAQAHRDWKAAIGHLTKLQDDKVEEWRTLELERLDEMWQAIYPHLQSGNLYSVDRGVKVSESRRKLLGIDAPQQHEIAGKGGGAIQVQTKHDLTGLTDEELLELQRIRSKLLAQS